MAPTDAIAEGEQPAALHEPAGAAEPLAGVLAFMGWEDRCQAPGVRRWPWRCNRLAFAVLAAESARGWRRRALGPEHLRAAHSTRLSLPGVARQLAGERPCFGVFFPGGTVLLKRCSGAFHAAEAWMGGVIKQPARLAACSAIRSAGRQPALRTLAGAGLRRQNLADPMAFAPRAAGVCPTWVSIETSTP